MLLSDFCIDPTNNLLQTISSGETYDMVSYYSTCNGTNPIVEPLTLAYTYAQDLDTAYTSLLQACPNDPNIIAAQDEVPKINDYLNGIKNVAACPPLQHEINNVLHSGLCYNTFVGFFIIWLSQFWTAIALFVSTMIISFMYLYFERHISRDSVDVLEASGSNPAHSNKF
jgi:hypothetical protein